MRMREPNGNFDADVRMACAFLLNPQNENPIWPTTHQGSVHPVSAVFEER